jgi:type II secretory pathway component PulC
MSVRAIKILFLALNLLLAGGSAVAGGAFFLSFLRQAPPRRQASSTPSTRKADLPEGGKPIAHYAAIWRMKALPSDNQAQAAPVERAPVPNEERIRQILLGLFDVTGIVCNITKPADSYAILILKKESRTETVKPGEQISGAKVEEIRIDEVLFSYQGIAGVGVPMGTGAPSGTGPRLPGAAPGVLSPSPVGAPTQPVEIAPGKPLPFTSRTVGPNTWEIDRREVQYIQGNQSKMIDDLRPTPEIDKATNKQTGVRLQNVPADSLAAQRGLQQGDIVKSINGIPVDSMDMAAIGKKIGKATTVTVQVERKGRLVSFNYTIR